MKINLRALAIASTLALSGCGQSLNKSGSEVRDSELSSAGQTHKGGAQKTDATIDFPPQSKGVDFRLDKVSETASDGVCELIFTVRNSTSANLTFGNYSLTGRDSEGSVTGTADILFNRIKPSEITSSDVLIRGTQCSEIKSLNIEVSAVQIDGILISNITDSQLISKFDAGSKISRVIGVSIK